MTAMVAQTVGTFIAKASTFVLEKQAFISDLATLAQVNALAQAAANIKQLATTAV